jgi:hypothetical protein
MDAAENMGIQPRWRSLTVRFRALEIGNGRADILRTAILMSERSGDVLVYR